VPFGITKSAGLLYCALYVSGQLEYCLPTVSIKYVLKSRRPPIYPLPRLYGSRYLVVSGRILDLVALDIIYRKNEVSAPKYFFSLEKSQEFFPAKRASEKIGRDHGDQEGRGVNSQVDPRFPILPPQNIIPILKYRNLLAGLRSYFPLKCRAQQGYSATIMLVIEASITQKCCWRLFGHLVLSLE